MSAFSDFRGCPAIAFGTKNFAPSSTKNKKLRESLNVAPKKAMKGKSEEEKEKVIIRIGC